jgi:hypothetical protein
MIDLKQAISFFLPHPTIGEVMSGVSDNITPLSANLLNYENCVKLSFFTTT